MTRWSTLAGSFRFFESFTLIYFIPSFYLKVYPSRSAEFSVLYALLVGFGGTLSNMLGGLIADARKDRNPMIHQQIGKFCGFIGVPIMAATCLFKGMPFKASLFFLFLKYLFTELWKAPTITMMQDTTKPEKQGAIVSVFLFFLTASGCLSTILMSQMAQLVGANLNPWLYGKLIFTGSTIGYLGSIPCYWLAGRHYKRFLEERYIQQES